jgi:hypothetical protein
MSSSAPYSMTVRTIARVRSDTYPRFFNVLDDATAASKHKTRLQGRGSMWNWRKRLSKTPPPSALSMTFRNPALRLTNDNNTAVRETWLQELRQSTCMGASKSQCKVCSIQICNESFNQSNMSDRKLTSPQRIAQACPKSPLRYHPNICNHASHTAPGVSIHSVAEETVTALSGSVI